MMKKTIALTAALMLSCSAMAMSASAADTADTKVFVTIADGEGKLVLTQEEIAVTDADNDGALTINDVLVLAHDAKFEGGAAAGYASSEGQYGLMINKLWGTENGGSYGYYVNNKAANSLGDAVSNGDYINAFVYQDTSSWSDVYCFFDQNKAETEQGSEITLTLSKAGYDADWNPVTVPEDGAVILINGEATSYFTDAEGKVTVKFENAGTNVVSATCTKDKLVPPVFIAEVAAAPTDSETETTTDDSDDAATTGAETDPATEPEDDTADGEVADGEEAAAEEQTVVVPATGDSGVGLAFALIGAASAAAFLARRRNED